MSLGWLVFLLAVAYWVIRALHVRGWARVTLAIFLILLLQWGAIALAGVGILWAIVWWVGRGHG